MTEIVKSPCVSVCYVNDDALCEGCFRTIEEISDWTHYNNDAKQDVIKRCNERRQAQGWVL